MGPCCLFRYCQAPEVLSISNAKRSQLTGSGRFEYKELKQKSMQELEKQRRRASSCVERKGRKTSASTTTAQPSKDGSHPGPQPAKRKRGASMINTPPHLTEDELVDIDEQSTHSYLHMDHDRVPLQHIRDRLKHLAHDWTGSLLSSYSLLTISLFTLSPPYVLFPHPPCLTLQYHYIAILPYACPLIPTSPPLFLLPCRSPKCLCSPEYAQAFHTPTRTTAGRRTVCWDNRTRRKVCSEWMST